MDPPGSEGGAVPSTGRGIWCVTDGLPGSIMRGKKGIEKELRDLENHTRRRRK